MKRIALFLLIVSMCLSCSSTKTPTTASSEKTSIVEFYSPSKEEAFIYAKPNSSESNNFRIPRSGKVLVMKKFDDNWYLIKYEGQEFYALITDFVPTNSLEPTPEINQNYSTPTKSSSSSSTIHTGPRGGKYYINSKGNKTYIKH